MGLWKRLFGKKTEEMLDVFLIVRGQQARLMGISTDYEVAASMVKQMHKMFGKRTKCRIIPVHGVSHKYLTNSGQY